MQPGEVCNLCPYFSCIGMSLSVRYYVDKYSNPVSHSCLHSHEDLTASGWVLCYAYAQ